MTAASISYSQRARLTGIDRVALLLGLALVAWARRSSQRPSVSYDLVRKHRESVTENAARLRPF